MIAYNNTNNQNLNILKTKIGIIGGGQLGKMMILEAKKLGFYVAILDPVKECPADSIADFHIVSDFSDENAIRELAKMCDVITYEFEHINSDALLKLENEGYTIYPTAKSLKIIQNKFTQKSVIQKAGIPVPEFMQVNDFSSLENAANIYNYPFILKSCQGGYDGKGNYVIRCNEDLENFSVKMNNTDYFSSLYIAEKYIDFEMEVSVLACRSISGDVAVYPVGQNIHIDNILRKTIVPAPISDRTKNKAMETAKNVMEVFNGVGMFCVEMFVLRNGEILINEVAPRPHNSGHYTIESCITSQFNQHIRAITGLPLGSPEMIIPAVMRNILGDTKHNGEAIVYGISEALEIEGCSVHIYGKKNTSPKRKMGHLTVLNEDINIAEKLADKAFELVKVKS